MKIISSFNRDRLLHKLYRNKELLCFVNGNDWFQNQVNEIWLAYYDNVNMPEKFRDIEHDNAKWEFFNL